MALSPKQKRNIIAISVILGLALAGSLGYLGYFEYCKRNPSSRWCKKGPKLSFGPGPEQGPGYQPGELQPLGSNVGPVNPSHGYPSSTRPESMMPDYSPYGTQQTRYDLLEGGRRRSQKATGNSADNNQGCYNQNLVGSVQAPTDLKVGSSRTYMPSAPMGSKPAALSSTRLSGGRRGKGYAGAPKRTRVDLSAYSRMGVDRAMGAQGLALPEDLALASAQLGHIEIAENTRTDSVHPWGETPYSWNVGYSVNTSGMLEVGNGHIPTYGPAQLALRQRGVSY